ncbi:MAG: hypothetical protein JXA73_06600 [Acidobacteria bacterium]|nr:hypothetical protein [Acidobacteriota bacterium]
MRQFIILPIVITAACIFAFSEDTSNPIPAQLRQRLLNSIGESPRNLAGGYMLEGRFILKATGEEIPYKARYVRASDRWAADFSQDDPSRNLRYVFSGKEAWIASPEITADLKPESAPYMARLDFYQLYEALLGILERGVRDPAFGIEAIANEIHVTGKLQNGWAATFVFNVVDYFPRKVSVIPKDKSSAAWLIPLIKPDGSSSLQYVPGPSTGFEIWMSDPVDSGGHRYARRLDYIEGGNVVGTFLLDKSFPIAETEGLFNRPRLHPWVGSFGFKPDADSSRPTLFLNTADLHSFRTRLESNPWSGWDRMNRLIALWATALPWIGYIIPPSVSSRLISLAVMIFLIGLGFVLLRRRRQTGDPFRWSLFLVGLLFSCIILFAWIASRQLHNPRDRSLIALHSAMRYAATGRVSQAAKADALLSDFMVEAPAQSMEDLGYSCQAYAFAYDLIRPDLKAERQEQIERDLIQYAMPLFGASRGWSSNMPGSSVISAGLGMTGLALSYEPYITAAREVIDKTLEGQLVGGLHRSGPGPGSAAMDSAVNFFYGLKNAGRADYFSHVSFRKYLSATLQMLSPVGTLPLFGNTSLDQSSCLSAFFLKTANHVPVDAGRQCMAAYDRYWTHGRYHASGWLKWILPAIQPAMMFYKNPYILFQYTQELRPASLKSPCAILGEGQMAVLRTGEDPDSAYLALNMTRSNYAAHRDILTFDMYACRSLLLNGPGFPGTKHPAYHGSTRTAASNSITLNGEDQAATKCTGIETSLLNQPVFDYVRGLADKTYDYGQVKRDIVMARPEKDHPAYFLLLDDVFVSDNATAVQWHLHGRGKLATGVSQVSRWTSAAFNPPNLWPDRVILEASHPMGVPGSLSKVSGTTHSPFSCLSQISEGVIIEWTGSRRFCSVLTPRKPGEAQMKMEPVGNNSFRIGTSDWVSLGNHDTRVTAGPLMHISEYAVVRDRKQSFPALLLVSGLELRIHSHSLKSSKPVTASLRGLSGGFMNTRPDTRVEILSPSIEAGSRFRLDDQPIIAAESGVLILTLGTAGTHVLEP